MIHRPRAAPGSVPFAVLGDSDSHSYRDAVSFADDPSARGGRLRSRTFQWNEILAGLRADALDPGPWGRWGTDRGYVTRWQQRLGLPVSRFPRKEDYRYNFAQSGALCEALMDPPRRQAPNLLATMDRDPGRWREGVVLVRIGTNSFGKVASLDALARDPRAPGVVAVMDGCLGQIGRAVALIRARHPQTRFVLVGIFNNAHWGRYQARWRSAAAQANIAAGLRHFDDALRAMAAAEPRTAFFDDQAWFERLWGSRDASGLPDYRSVNFGRGFRVTNTEGDEPSHATLADGHAGTVWNALWAQALVTLMNDRLDLAVAPLREPELVDLIDPDGAFGMR